jgi:hypothetical protein
MEEKKMKTKQRLCPISHRDCRQCVLFRGKHLYLNVCRAAPGAPDKKIKALSAGKPVIYKTAKGVAGPKVKKSQAEPLPNIAIKVVDAQTETSAFHDLKEAEKWDWNDSTLTRVSEDKNVDDWDELVEIARSKAESGYRELVVREIPRFMLHEDAG